VERGPRKGGGKKKVSSVTNILAVEKASGKEKGRRGRTNVRRLG